MDTSGYYRQFTEGQEQLDGRTPEVRQTQRLPFRKRLIKRITKRDSKKFMKYVQSTSTHGITHIFIGKSKTRRLFWGLLFLAASVSCFYNVSTLITYYFSVPTATTASTVHEDELHFPAITICNLNQFRTSYLKERNLTNLVRSALNLRLTNSSTFLEEYEQQCSPNKFDESTNITIQQVSQEGGQKAEEFIVDCTFQGLPCNISNDFVPLQTSLGICYTFNNGKTAPIRQVVGGGTRHALQLVLNVEQHEYSGSLTHDAGVRVRVHSPDEIPRAIEHGIVVPPGKNAYMGITPHVVDDQSETGTCKQSNTDPHFTLLQGYRYSLSACLKDCLVTKIAQNCDCIDSSIDPPTRGPYADHPPCLIRKMCCIVASLTITENCKCHKSCYHSSHVVSTSYAAFPTVNEIQSTADRFNVTADIVQHSFLGLHVYFEELVIQKQVTVRSYDIFYLISDIGGQLGLFIGASVISLTEFFVWILDELKDRCLGIDDKKLKNQLESVSSEIRERFLDENEDESLI